MRKALEQTEQPQETGFSLKVTYRDEKTGLVTSTDPYILRVIGSKDSEEKLKLWERPKGSGNLYNKKNEPVGRWVDGKWDRKAEHIAFEKPLTQDQKLAKSLTEKDVQIAELQRELAAVKAEQDKKAQAQSQANGNKGQGA